MNPNPSSSRKPAAGFTLVELMVVIAIVSLLVALLAPSLKRARNLALQTKCAANLKQIGLSLACYVEDNRQNLPPVSIGNENDYTWATSILSYSGLETSFPVTSIFTCPRAIPRFASPPNPNHWRLTYGFATYLGTWANPPATYSAYHPGGYKMAMTGNTNSSDNGQTHWNPPDIAMTFDCGSHNDYYPSCLSNYPDNYLHNNEGVNVLALDQHAEFISKEFPRKRFGLGPAVQASGFTYYFVTPTWP